MGSPERYTPEHFADLVTEAFDGEITVDPASCARANKTIKAKHYYDISTNGLVQPWKGNVFLNPPYDDMRNWIDKLLDEFNRCAIKQAILLSNTATDTEWFDLLCCPFNRSEPIFCDVVGRIRFISGVGSKIDQPRYPSRFTYFGDNKVKFCEVFSRVGNLSKLVKPSDFKEQLCA